MKADGAGKLWSDAQNPPPGGAGPQVYVHPPLPQYTYPCPTVTLYPMIYSATEESVRHVVCRWGR